MVNTVSRPLNLRDCVNDVCPLTRRPVRADALVLYKGQVMGFADPALRDNFAASIVLFEAALSSGAAIGGSSCLVPHPLQRPPQERPHDALCGNYGAMSFRPDLTVKSNSALAA